jgi:FkbM family methyltransferase
MELRTFRSPRGRKIMLNCRPGTNDAMMAESSLDQDEYGLRSLELTGVAVDVGAHIGMVTIGLLKDNDHLRVLAVEPVAENVALLLENAALNDVADRVTVLEGAAAKPTAKTVTIAYDFRGGEMQDMHRFVGNQPMPEGTRQTTKTVPAITLPFLVRQAGGAIDLLVTDCEGGEYDLLQGAALAKVAHIRGEYHDGWARLEKALAATHDVGRTGDDDAFGGFRATLR